MKNKQSAFSIHQAASRNEKGIALVIVMVLSAIGLAIMAGLVYMLTSGTQVSGIQKKYKTALEAGAGGVDVTFQLIGARGDPGIPITNFLITASSACLTDKLTKSTANWAVGCNSSLTINPASTATYDIIFDVGSSPVYTVYAKIADTVEGNSSGDTGLIKGGVVASNSGEVTVMSIPYLYTVEIDAENAANSAERAKMSVLYQY